MLLDILLVILFDDVLLRRRGADGLFDLVGEFIDDRRLIERRKFCLEVGKIFHVAHVLVRGDEVVRTEPRKEHPVCVAAGRGRGTVLRFVADALGKGVGTRVDAVRLVIVVLFLRIDARGRRADGRLVLVDVLAVEELRFLRVEGVVDDLTRRIQRKRLLVVVKEVCERGETAVEPREPFDRGAVPVRRDIGLALVRDQIEHRILHIDLAVDERLADHVERIVIRPAVRLHHAVSRRNEICDHVALGDDARTDHVAVRGVFAVRKIFALGDVDFCNGLRIVLADIGGNIAACKERRAECRGKRNCRYFCCLSHSVLRNDRDAARFRTAQFLSIILYLREFRNDFAMKIM